MNSKQKQGLSYIVFIPVIAVVISTVFRICTNTTQNVSLDIADKANDYTPIYIPISDECTLEFEVDAPVSGLTGFGFRFDGDRNYFDTASFFVTASIRENALNDRILYEGKMPLIEQAYDYQSLNFIVLIPFEDDIRQGDHLYITIAGDAISEEAGVLVKCSRHPRIDGTILEINGARQDSTLAGVLYYQTGKLNVFPILMQGIVFILLILLTEELLKKKKIKAESQRSPLVSNPISFRKKIIILLPAMILVIAALDYTRYAGIKMRLQDLDLVQNKINLLFLLFSALVIGLTFVIFWCGQNNMRLEKILFLTVVFLGILFELVITPFAAPDEASHIDTAYRISNQMLGIEDTGIKDAIHKRECDIYTDSGIKSIISVETYEWLYDDWSKTEGNRNTKLAFASDNRNSTNSLYYLFSAVAITISRLMGIGFLPMVYLARTANLLFAAWLIYLAVKKIPFGKSVLCVIALLPMTLQQIASCSYDAMIIPISMLYVSFCVFALYSEEKLERTDILIVFITAVMLGICKGGAYTPLYLLGLWILVKRGYIKLPRKKVVIMSAVVAAVCLVLVGVIVVVLIYRRPLDAYAPKNGHYSLAYLIRNFVGTIRLLEDTVYHYTQFYVQQLFGEGLGYIQISVKCCVPIGYMILLGIAVIGGEKYSYVPGVMDKCVFMITAVLVIAAVETAFLLAVPFGSDLISGVQGRYFLPAVWLFLICFRSSNIVNKNKKYMTMMLTGWILGVFTVLQVVIGVLNPNI